MPLAWSLTIPISPVEISGRETNWNTLWSIMALNHLNILKEADEQRLSHAFLKRILWHKSRRSKVSKERAADCVGIFSYDSKPSSCDTPLARKTKLSSFGCILISRRNRYVTLLKIQLTVIFLSRRTYCSTFLTKVIPCNISISVGSNLTLLLTSNMTLL